MLLACVAFWNSDREIVKMDKKKKVEIQKKMRIK